MDRAYLKSKAKLQLKDNLVISIITVFIASIFIDASIFKNGIKLFHGEGSYFSIDLISLLLGGVFSTGLCRFLLNIITNLKNPEINDLFSYFNIYFKTLGLNILIAIFTLLGFIFFIVPGFILSIMFSQAFFILAEDPSKSIMDCISESTRMMDGNKADYFVLQLSFIGWYLLSIFTLGIASFWVNPYVKLTNANYYLTIK